MAEITMNIDQSILRQAEAVFAVYGRSIDEVFAKFLENTAKTGDLSLFEEETPFTAEEEALIDEAIALSFHETEEEFFAKLEEAKADCREGRTMTLDEFHQRMVEKFPYLGESVSK